MTSDADKQADVLGSAIEVSAELVREFRAEFLRIQQSVAVREDISLADIEWVLSTAITLCSDLTKAEGLLAQYATALDLKVLGEVRFEDYMGTGKPCTQTRWDAPTPLPQTRRHFLAGAALRLEVLNALKKPRQRRTAVFELEQPKELQ